MKRTDNYVSGVRITLLTLLFLCLSFPIAHAEDTCVDCHKNEKFRVQNKMLFDYYNNWKDSIHDLSGVTCRDCHGGDATKSDKDAAHKENFSNLSSVDREAFKKIPEKCGTCHEAVLKNFMESSHYKTLLEKGTGPHCATCHGSMNAEVYYTPIVSMTCKECHNEYTKNRPEVTGEADKILHRINVSRVFRNWISIHYAEKDLLELNEINSLYKDMTDSWHTFDFTELDEKSENLLSRLKSLVNRRLIEKRKK